MQPYAAELERLLKTFDKQLEILAERIRTELVVPACKRHRLCFVSGNGTFFFRRKGTKNEYDALEPTYGNSEDLEYDVPPGYRPLSSAAKKTLGPILDLLNQEISHGEYLGYLVSDVD
jgi:hypothetical protein